MPLKVSVEKRRKLSVTQLSRSHLRDYQRSIYFAPSFVVFGD